MVTLEMVKPNINMNQLQKVKGGWKKQDEVKFVRQKNDEEFDLVLRI